ncbi:MAG TPA: squalene/phytoene synthase family protein [Luteolibacter sp.]|nr:squalene/phytoene synthase family protein [Luteolibacter sp.]
MSEATQITRRARSNLAFALRVLPRDRRDDAVVFYAFCRTLDDLADEPGIPSADRRRKLEAWKHGLERGFQAPDSLQREVLALRDRRQIPTELLTAIVDGCLMDLEPRRFPTWDDLDGYIWKVACAVGLVSIRIFGCTDPASENYAIALGRALQLTNILRDVGEDFANGGRIYLPLEEMARHGCNQEALAQGKRDAAFLALMNHVAERADGHFREVADVLPAADRRALAPARIMAEIYQTLLGTMRRDGFRVFEQRYHVPRPRKLWILAKHLIAG